MKLYVAGNGRSPNSSQIDYDTGTRNRLLSYAFIDDWAKDEFKFWIDAAPPGACVFLDSGAFSAHTKKTVIDLGKYCEYCKEHEHALAAYAVLDVIGSLEGTMANLREMRRRGLKPVPVYHADREPLSVYEELLDGSDYVCIGGMVGTAVTKERLNAQLDKCFRVTEKHWPVRVHGLGLTTQHLLERYPFYSSDSSSAIRGAGMGSVIRFRDRRSGIERLRLTAEGWRDDVRHFGDGAVVDGVGRVKDETAARSSNSAHQGRRICNIQAQLTLERALTSMWARRGVTWEETR